MNRIEVNCAMAVKSYLITGLPSSIVDTDWLARLAAAAAKIAALPPATWDAETETTIPRIVLTVTQGEETVYPLGVYSLSISLETVVRAKQNEANSVDGAIQELLGDVGELAAELTTAHFHCYGRQSGLSRKTETGDGKRHTTITFDVVGFDLDRFAQGSLEIMPESDFVSSGENGGPFNPASKNYTLTNTGEASIDWTATAPEWIALSSEAGSLDPEEQEVITASIDAADKPNGTYVGNITFTSGAQKLVIQCGLVAGASGGGENVNYRAGSTNIANGGSVVPIVFNQPFDAAPSYYEAWIENPAGQPVITIAQRSADQNGINITLDLPTPAAGYKARYFALE